jgi:hypothetical protein
MEKRSLLLLLLPLPPAPVYLTQWSFPTSWATHKPNWSSFSRVITLTPRRCFHHAHCPTY